ncbi:MAG: tRNA (N6-threonylcarbamoyladenosine(37)-N6)-methyltransferase TrmO [Candidatus Altiarchaeota archaeon]
MTKTSFNHIGVIHTPFKTLDGIPIQASRSDASGEVEVFQEYSEGLSDIEGFSHIILLYHLHKSAERLLKVKPFLDDVQRGVFSTRAPWRPNPIGISTVELLGRKDNLLKVNGVDVLDGTPLLDIKPYVPEFDWRENIRIGWLDGKTD